MSLDLFTPAARAWFEATFERPTAVQDQGWKAVAGGRHTLMTAPTGSGKTLAAFLWCLDRLAAEPVPVEAERCRVLYISPLKALTVDVERNLRPPLIGLRHHSPNPPEIKVAIRTGDTPPEDPGGRAADRGASFPLHRIFRRPYHFPRRGPPRRIERIVPARLRRDVPLLTS